MQRAHLCVNDSLLSPLDRGVFPKSMEDQLFRFLKAKGALIINSQIHSIPLCINCNHFISYQP